MDTEVNLDNSSYKRYLEIWGYVFSWLDKRKILRWLPPEETMIEINGVLKRAVEGRATIEMNDLVNDIALRILAYETENKNTPLETKE